MLTNISFKIGFYVGTGIDFEIPILTYFISSRHLNMAYNGMNLSVTTSSCWGCLQLVNGKGNRLDSV